MDKRKKPKKRKTNNLNFIATYLFEFPGSSATDVRKALWVYNNKKWKDIKANGYSDRKTYLSYFQITSGRSHRGYAGKYWTKMNRCRWTLTSDGIFYVRKTLIKSVHTANKRVKKHKNMCRPG